MIDYEPEFTQKRVEALRETMRNRGITQEQCNQVVRNLRQSLIRRGILESQVMNIDSLGSTGNE